MSDLIRRTDVIDFLEQQRQSILIGSAGYTDANEIADTIEVLKTILSSPLTIKSVQQWIPCSERMPSEQDYPEQKYRVLASCSDGIVRNASIKSMLNGEKKYALGHIEFTYEAWMPLPPAFKGE